VSLFDKTADEDANPYFDVYLAVSTVNSTTDLNPELKKKLNTKYIEMVPCTSIDNF
jgi:hypothetical protein